MSIIMKTSMLYFMALTSTVSTSVMANHFPQVFAGLSLGTLSGEAKERVYEPGEGGRKISQLNWKYQNAPIIKGNLNWDLTPVVRLGVSGWATLAGASGRMDDYDWNYRTQKGWSHHSGHPDTQLNYANEIDVNLTGWLFRNEKTLVGLIAGYRQTAFDWSSKGGYYNYENGVYVGAFDPNQRAIDYHQRLKIPYIGVTGSLRHEQIEVSGDFKYSRWVLATADDVHYQRMLTFRDTVKNQNYYAVSASAGYYITDNIKVYLEGTWNRASNKKGSVDMRSPEFDTSVTRYNASGIEHTSFLTALGAVYKF